LPDGTEQTTHRRVVTQPIEEEMKRSYIDYAMSVIVGRALPDLRDGLKPVQRRILYAMNDLSMGAGTQHKKCARVVGEIIGKYHPHGDMAVYDALVRMAQDFSMRSLLVDGQGNFGSVDGDPPAAMRYTECRLSRTSEELLQDIEKETVDWVDNFDGTLKEPTILPAKFPNLLVNGSSGIAVGMATNIPPHNLTEVADALVALIENPEAQIEDLFNPETGPIKGPDFPTGGIIYGIQGVIEAYRLGRGLICLRAKAHFEEAGRDRARIVITEIPYMVNKAALVESIALLVKEKKLDGVTDLRDESDRSGMRVVLELRKDAMEDVVLNQLYARTQMEATFGVINLALVNGEPKVLTLRETLQSYVDYREQVVRRRTQFDLTKTQQREHIVEGLITAVDHLDEVVRLIRRSKDADEARSGLMNRFLLSEEQSKAILDLRLQKLTGLEVKSLRDEQGVLKKKIEGLHSILVSREKIRNIIKQELLELKEKYGDERRSEIQIDAEEMDIEDLIPEEDVIVTITNTGYVKRLTVDTYRQQGRGGKGRIGMETKEEDYVVNLFVASTHEFILFLSSKGKCYWLKTWRIPSGGTHAKGRPIINMLPRLDKDERIQAMIPVKEFDEKRTIFFATKKGKIKRTRLGAFKRPMVRGIKAIKLLPGDELIAARLSEGNEEVILASNGGYANRFDVGQVRTMGRTAAGVRGMKLRSGDAVVGMTLATDPGKELLTMLENGLGKRTLIAEYRKTKRGSQGVMTTKIKLAKSKVVNIVEVSPEEELLVTTVRGMVIRIPVAGIRKTGRSAKGVRIIRLKEKDRVTAVVKIISEKEEEKAVGKESGPDQHQAGA
jgi:DNA gyrase subunit A